MHHEDEDEDEDEDEYEDEARVSIARDLSSRSPSSGRRPCDNGAAGMWEIRAGGAPRPPGARGFLGRGRGDRSHALDGDRAHAVGLGRVRLHAGAAEVRRARAPSAPAGLADVRVVRADRAPLGARRVSVAARGEHGGGGAAVSGRVSLAARAALWYRGGGRRRRAPLLSAQRLVLRRHRVLRHGRHHTAAGVGGDVRARLPRSKRLLAGEPAARSRRRHAAPGAAGRPRAGIARDLAPPAAAVRHPRVVADRRAGDGLRVRDRGSPQRRMERVPAAPRVHRSTGGTTPRSTRTTTSSARRWRRCWSRSSCRRTGTTRSGGS